LKFALIVECSKEVKRWQLVQIAVIILMVSQVRGCGFISATTVEDTFVIIVVQRLEVVFVALNVTLTTLKKITSATEALVDQ